MLPIYVSKHLRVKPEVALSSWTRGSIKYARMTQREADVSVHQSMGRCTGTIKVFEQYGARFLTAEEIRTEIPHYPL